MHRGRSTKEIMDVDRFHARGYKGKGIKIAILDSGLGQEFQQINSNNDDDSTRMNIVKIIDFTNESRRDE